MVVRVTEDERVVLCVLLVVRVSDAEFEELSLIDDEADAVML